MKQVAKVLIWNEKNETLLLLRLNNHPVFGNDPDLPGGTVDSGETPKMAAIREVAEEAGVVLDESKVMLRAKDTTTSTHNTEYYVYETRLDYAPEVVLSWEHESYEWVDKKTLIVAATAARDTYMHVVARSLKGE